MARLNAQFKEASSNVEPSDADKQNAPKAHKDVREVLEQDEVLKSWGIDTILIGSYGRRVTIKRLSDVDVFSKLPDVGNAKKPKAILDRFEKVLTDHYGKDRVSRQDRSIKVDFPDFDMHVDCVPARPADDVWEIPDQDGSWVLTNPEKLGDLTTELNGEHVLSGQGMYVPMVKLVRQTRAHQLGDSQPGGLYFEVLTYWAFDSGEVEGDSRAEYFTTTLEQVSVELDNAVKDGLKDPTLDDALIQTRASPEGLEEAADTFRELAKKARKALDEEDDCKSAKMWREILGENPDGQVFPLPNYCNADGTRKADLAEVIPGEVRVPAGDDRFA